MSTRKISSVLVLATLGIILSVIQISIANAKNITTNSDEVESMIEITDIIEKEMQKSTDYAKFDIFNTGVTGNHFLWSPDGSKLLIYTYRNMMTKGLDSIYDTRRVKCGEYGLHERASTLFWMNADGSEITNIARTEESIRAAKNNTAAFIDSENSVWWSPSGDKIVFVLLTSCDQKPSNLYIADINGSILTEVKGFDYPGITWSPDGSKINILDRHDLTTVYVIDVENSTVKQLHLGISAMGYGLNDMKWSPDGKKIAFIGKKDGGIYTVNVDNSSVQQLTTNVQTLGLRWTPDGTKLVFYTVAPDRLYVMNADGSNITLIKEWNFSSGLWALWSWSRDGKKLYFPYGKEINSSQDYVLDIEAMTANPVASVQDTRGPSDNSFYFKNSTLVKVNPDGTETPLVKNVPTDMWYNEDELIPSPDGSRVLFTFGLITGRTPTYILKMKGYDDVLSIYTPNSIKQGDSTFIEVKSMSKPVENATIFLNGREIGKTNESGFLRYSFNESGNLRLSAAKQGFRTANKSITVQESPSESTLIITPQITESVTVAVTPKAPGFGAMLAIVILFTINLFKRRYN